MKIGNWKIYEFPDTKEKSYREYCNEFDNSFFWPTILICLILTLIVWIFQ